MNSRMDNFSITQNIVNVLIVDEEPKDARQITKALNEKGFEIEKKKVNSFLYKMKDLGLVLQCDMKNPPRYSVNKISY
jgi:repressor of nif and glnA expression